MSVNGRGSFLQLKRDAKYIYDELKANIENASNYNSLKSINSTSEYSRIGRGKLLYDISSCDSKSLANGHGRASIFQAIKVQETVKALINIHYCDSPSGSNKSVSCEKREEWDAPLKKGSHKFYKPMIVHGLRGTPVNLACNYIRLVSDPNKGVYIYEVRFNPTVDSVNLRMKYLNEHREKFGGTKSFDGVTLYLPILLRDQLTTYVSKSLMNSSDIEIRILFKRKETLQNCIHLYNVLFDRVMKTLNYVRFDRKQFDPTSPKIIPHTKLEVWPGYVIAVDEYEGGLMLCCDISHRLLCQKTVLETLVEIFHYNPHMFHDNAKKSLIGSVVITKYNNRTYRIDDICFEKTPLCTFKTKQSELSYIEYYRRNHNIQIKDRNQPLLISVKKRRRSDIDISENFVFCLIPEVCYLTGLRDELRSDYKLMREIATFTRVSPNQRILALEKFHNNINDCSEAKEILENWGLSLNRTCEYVTGRQLDEEKVYFGKSNFSVGLNANFSKHAIQNELLEVIPLHNWILIHNKNDSKCAKTFSEHLFRTTHALGISIRKPKIIILENDRIESYVNCLRNNIDKELQIIVCICSVRREDRYAAIKKVCCAENPMPSQIINANTLSNEKNNRSIVQKIVLQMNCKLGGSLWTINIPFKNVMICGIDSYHDVTQKGNSVAALVSSLNQSYTKWYSKAVIQSKGEEIVNGLCSSFIAALLAYQKINGKLPDSVIIYRDGLGDGQLQLSNNYEIPQLESACQKAFSKYLLKITFIVVQKRINTRYLMVKPNSFENPSPGTVVDKSITRGQLYNFFLVSQSVWQGTVSPTHYVVLKDVSAYSPDIIQRLSYKMCYLYYNWTGSIRVPACIQYAHKMAYLVGQSIRRNTSDELSEILFYL